MAVYFYVPFFGLIIINSLSLTFVISTRPCRCMYNIYSIIIVKKVFVFNVKTI